MELLRSVLVLTNPYISLSLALFIGLTAALMLSKKRSGNSSMSIFYTGLKRFYFASFFSAIFIFPICIYLLAVWEFKGEAEQYMELWADEIAASVSDVWPLLLLLFISPFATNKLVIEPIFSKVRSVKSRL